MTVGKLSLQMNRRFWEEDDNIYGGSSTLEFLVILLFILLMVTVERKESFRVPIRLVVQQSCMANCQ